jgi:hypothetical protein
MKKSWIIAYNNNCLVEEALFLKETKKMPSLWIERKKRSLFYKVKIHKE